MELGRYVCHHAIDLFYFDHYQFLFSFVKVSPFWSSFHVFGISFFFFLWLPVSLVLDILLYHLVFLVSCFFLFFLLSFFQPLLFQYEIILFLIFWLHIYSWEIIQCYVIYINREILENKIGILAWNRFKWI